MHYEWKDIPGLLRTPVGRSHLTFAIRHKSWPVLSRLAAVYRRTLIRNTRVVAVVGSFAKTTTARALTKTLSCRVPTRFGPNAYYAIARAVLGVRPHDRHAVIEVGIARPGQMEVYARLIKPDITVVTSIGSEHNLSLRTVEVTRAEKSEMVKILPPSGIAVLNGDDPNVLWMKGQTHARVLTFGIDRANDVSASDITLDWPNGTRFKLHAGGEKRDLRICLIGRHMVYPILAAVAVSLAEGFTLDQIIPGLEALSPTPSRLEPIRLENGAIILRDDYKSSLETIEAALDVLSEIPAERRMVVLGEVGEPTGPPRAIYRSVGERVGRIAERATFIVRQNGKYKSYATGAVRGGLSRDALLNSQGSIRKVVEILQRELRPGDVVLIKGRDNQRLERVSLSLMGRKVRCDISFCDLKLLCEHCPMLEDGWKHSKVAV
jgi:UDP-N-acetylmuramyl pentapeptide synthase